VKELVGHASITTTFDIYGHLTVEDARRTVGGGELVHRTGGAAVTAAATVAGRRYATARPATIRRHLINLAGRIDRHARGVTIHLPEH
jgi:hypothetical protein